MSMICPSCSQHRQLSASFAALESRLAGAESALSEAVAKEAARWRDFANYVHTSLESKCSEEPCSCDICNVLDAASSIVSVKSSDWLAQHDAEVAARAVEPWRKALKEMYSGCTAETCDDSLAIRVKALISSAPATTGKNK